MATFKINKVNALPSTLEANSFYAVGDGVGRFTLYLTDSTGTSAYQLTVAEAFESISKNLRSDNYTLQYTSGVLTRIAYSSGVVKTFNYSPSGLSSVVLSGVIPGGPDLTKTLTYTSGLLTGVAYS